MKDTVAKTADAPTQDRLIANALIEDIVEWRIQPGSWIRERELAQRFGVSHAPVREAFRHIANIGFVQVVPWRGAHVIEIDRHAAIEVLELWKATFGVVCRLAATGMSDEDGQELMRRLEEYKVVVRETTNTFAHLAVSNRVGAFIARNCGGALAMEMLNRISLFARWQHHVISSDFFSGDAARESAELYEVLCGHIVAREADAADAAARALLGHLQERFAAPLDAYLAAKRVGVAKRGRKS
ncbi:MAG: GntR family transcriptional regulator [Pseudomonadota bacterium]